MRNFLSGTPNQFLISERQSRGDRYLSHSSHHTQVPVPVTKTITGKNSVDNRLSESIGQTNRVLLHMTADYNPGTLARSIKRFFELNPYAREVLVYKGK